MGILGRDKLSGVPCNSPQRRDSSYIREMKKVSVSGSHEWKTATSRHVGSNFKVESLERKSSKNVTEFFSALSPIKEKKKQPEDHDRLKRGGQSRFQLDLQSHLVASSNQQHSTRR